MQCDYLLDSNYKQLAVLFTCGLNTGAAHAELLPEVLVQLFSKG